MRSVDGLTDEVIAGAVGWRPRVYSWLGGRLLTADPVPVSDGKLMVSVTQAVPEKVSLSVPRWDGRDWRPGRDVTHPLARYGQELSVSIVVTSSMSSSSPQEWEVPLGRFIIEDWAADDDRGTIEVTALGRLRRVETAKLTSASQPQPGATLVSEARRLMPRGMAAAFDPALVDRACPGGMTWTSDRLGALQEIADAWPALLRTDEWGQVVFRPPLPDQPTPVLTLQDGPGGTLVSAPSADTRNGAYNQVVARSSAPDFEDIQEIAEQLTGPMATTSDYGVVTKEWSSPLITTRQQALASAQTMLRNSLVPAATQQVICASDPRIDLDDPVLVIRDGEPLRGWVVGYELPLTVGDGTMRVDVGVP